MFKSLLACTLAIICAAPAAAQGGDRGDHLYRMPLIRAAPGRLLDTIESVKAATITSRAFVFRHSQGDHWDLLVLVPVTGTLASLDDELADPDFVAWRQDELVRGPDLAARPGFGEAGLYHFEMFVALPGKRDELLREREMENAYLAAVGRPVTAIFVREFGAEWDSFTIGAYKSWTHYAERDRITPEQAAEAARKAGFKGDDQIGPYMRSLIALHHDTLTTPVR